MDWAARNPARVFHIAWALAFLILLGVGIFGSFYTVEANEEAVILRFGEIHTVSGPGFHSKLPFGIDTVHKGAVQTVNAAEFGFRTVSAGVKTQYERSGQRLVAEADMLTGDVNLAMVNWEVRWKISDLEDYLFRVRDPLETLRDVSQAVMRIEVGDRSVDEVLTTDRISIATGARERMQAQLDFYGCGILIVKVNLKGVIPPDPVREAFNRVEEAKQEKDRILNLAEGLRNQKIPAARGEAEKVVKEAEGYHVGRVNRAEGDVSAFLAVLAEYRKAPEVTRRRLYLEAMEEILPKVGGITVVDGEGPGVLKHLDLGEKGGK
jgi:membrane protease subunit HflK